MEKIVLFFDNRVVINKLLATIQGLILYQYHYIKNKHAYTHLKNPRVHVYREEKSDHILRSAIIGNI